MPISATQVDPIFFAAVEISSPEERAEYLRRACGDDPQLRQRVEELLEAHFAAGEFLEQSPATVLHGNNDDVQAGPGTVIGPYKLLQQIGEGGMGIVFMAEQIEPIQRTVALKIIKAGMDTRHVIARFEAERQALAMMDHLNIAKVLDAGTTESGRPYFVMDLVKGVPITQFCDEKHLSLRERLNLMLPICQAVQHAHQKGIIHRDIKPTNVLVAEYDNCAVPKVIDFGVAKATAQKLTEQTMFTEFGQVVGTVEYMSPEQAKFNQLDIDTRSDIYSLGVLLYELLAGSPPFEQKRLREAAFDEVLRIIREEEPPKPSTRLSASDALPSIAANRQTEPARLSRDIRGELDWIVMRSLDKDRHRRYQTALALAEDIQCYLTDQPVTACPPSALYRFRKFARRNKGGVLAVSAVTASVILGLVLASIGFFQARREASRADREAAHALVQANRSEEVSRFLKQMLEGVGPAVALGRDTVLVREILNKTAEHLNELKAQPEVEAELRHVLGQVYRDLGLYEKAEEMDKRALELNRAIYGNESAKVASDMNALASTLWKLNRYAESERMHREALAMRRKILGNDDGSVAQSLQNLGMTLLWSNKFDEAIPVFRESIDIRRRLYGHQSERTASSLFGLAVVLRIKNQLDESEKLHREVLAIRRRVFGEIHPSVADSLSGYANLLRDQGKLKEAAAMHMEALAMRRKLYGDQHPYVQSSLSYLLEVFMRQGSSGDAEDAISKAMEIGADNPQFLNTLAWKWATAPGDVLRQADHAVELVSRVVKLSPDDGTIVNTLGVAQYRAGRWHEALETLVRSMELRNGGDPHDWFFLAMSHHHLGQTDEARKWYDKAAEWMDKNQSKDDELRRFRAEAAELLDISEPQCAGTQSEGTDGNLPANRVER